MKKFTLIASLFIFVFSVNKVCAQTFISKHSTEGDSSVANGSGTIKIKNELKATGASVVVKWKLLNKSSNLTLAGTDWGLDGVCDNNLCQTPGPIFAGTTFTSAPYVSDSFDQFYALFNASNSSNGSSAWIQVEVNEGGSIGGFTRTLTFVATKTPTSIISIAHSEDEVSIFPNPASNYIDVLYSANSDVKTVAIYNLIGKLVNVYKVSDKNSARCTFTTDMPSGIYLVRIADSKGAVIATRKITRQ